MMSNNQFASTMSGLNLIGLLMKLDIYEVQSWHDEREQLRTLHRRLSCKEWINGHSY